ncbi:hypothetical protein, partial [Pseudomonas aeruginosa]|uniref:hypothetical protein n=1 Tax=Pseudomonas aeruginosa TaxID=287 RepID=UPI002238ABE2
PGQLAGGPARGERLKTIHWKYRQAPRKLELSRRLSIVTSGRVKQGRQMEGNFRKPEKCRSIE